MNRASRYQPNVTFMMFFRVLIVAFGICLCHRATPIEGKIFERCELAELLRYGHGLDLDDIANWVCIAQHTSSLNTSAFGGHPRSGSSHGLFQISDQYWCSPPGKGLACGVTCDRLRDDDISDDLDCVQMIYEEHQRLSGNGYNAWIAYQQYCQENPYDYVEDCFGKEDQEYLHSMSVTANSVQNYEDDEDDNENSKKRGKVYKRCELAKELFLRHKFPMEEIPTWVCIAQHESNYNTAAVGRLNADGSADHGLFQISDLYWCSLKGGRRKACAIPCSRLEDSDIADDVKCLRQIYDEHTRIAGNGFTAWTVYDAYCSGSTENYVRGCFDGIDVVAESKTYEEQQNPPVLRQEIPHGKVYEPCELANELRTKHHLPEDQIATWVCIAKHESNYNTSAIGYGDHGLFQISDIYWCSPPGKGFACEISCSDLEDSDISDDVECIRKIFDEHTRLSGDGFKAWTVYPLYCSDGRAEKYISHCPNVNRRPAITSPPHTHSIPSSIEESKPQEQGKIYGRCELAMELLTEHNMPMEEIPTWVCIAHHESGYDTSAVGRRNTDGSADHGIFQISDIYWCSHKDEHRKACGIPCSKLLDNDITDDVKCVQKIYDEHTRISGNGFTAWTVYNAYCNERTEQYVRGCFDGTASDADFRPPQRTTDIGFVAKNKPKGKIYEECELATELRDKHNVPADLISTWVCIAKYQSGLNTSSAFGNVHGLFHISDEFWCSPPGQGEACGMHCSDLEDSDISDDLECVNKIYEEHERLSGDGFNAWVVYQQFCSDGKADEYVNHCPGFKTTSSKKIHLGTKKTHLTAVGSAFIPKNKPKGKIYKDCELAIEMRDKHHVPLDQISTWVCIAKYQSGLNTSSAFSNVHGIFHISDEYWCSPPGKGEACGLHCSDLEDSDISDDLECVERIYEEHQRLSGDGFNAWRVYHQQCSDGRADEDLSHCANFKTAHKIHHGVHKGITKAHPSTSRFIPKNKPKGKIYEDCELAKEMRDKHHVPLDQISTWVCIAKYQSGLNTSSAFSNVHGIFHISDEYWCSPPGKGVACGLHCSDLEDSDISDDLECVEKIYEEHQRLSGDGFNAWRVYHQQCSDGRADEDLSHCGNFKTAHKIHHGVHKGITKAHPSTSRFIPKNKPKGKIYEDCELAKEMRDKHNVPLDQISTWVCIAKYQSGLNTSSAFSNVHGIFHISDEFWCSPPGKGEACGLHCSDLEDSDISDDLECVAKIYEEHQRLSGDGFNAWAVYHQQCSDGRADEDLSHCANFKTAHKIHHGAHKGITKAHPSASRFIPKDKPKGKIYEDCELAKEMRDKHHVPLDQISTWVCIAKYQSGLNTSSAFSNVHGIFHISDEYWCSPPGKGEACGLHCSDLEDSDISDDLECVAKIYEEHQRLSGDGFNAWAVYHQQCSDGRADEDLSQCAYFKTAHKIHHGAHKGITKAHPSASRFIPKNNPKGKIYEDCELAKEMRDKHNVPLDQISTWVCIAKYQSGLNTSSAFGNVHGIFHISDEYWCSPPGKGEACGLPCSDLEDSDISDDLECVEKIYEEHQRLSGDGFNAWKVYHQQCSDGRADEDLSHCANFKTAHKVQHGAHKGINKARPSASRFIPKNKPKGKIYDDCELAKEMRDKHHVPLDQISAWVCIAKYQSGLNTSSAFNNVHGIFHISDEYWCSPPGNGEACGLHCSDLEDSDISDDLECVDKIYEEHQRLYGDGFNAWAVYSQYCSGGRADEDIGHCPGFKTTTRGDVIKVHPKLGGGIVEIGNNAFNRNPFLKHIEMVKANVASSRIMSEEVDEISMNIIPTTAPIILDLPIAPTPTTYSQKHQETYHPESEEKSKNAFFKSSMGISRPSITKTPRIDRLQTYHLNTFVTFATPLLESTTQPPTTNRLQPYQLNTSVRQNKTPTTHRPHVQPTVPIPELKTTTEPTTTTTITRPGQYNPEKYNAGAYDSGRYDAGRYHHQNSQSSVISIVNANLEKLQFKEATSTRLIPVKEQQQPPSSSLNVGRHEFKPFATPTLTPKPSSAPSVITATRFDPFKPFSTIKPITVNTGSQFRISPSITSPTTNRNLGRYEPFKPLATLKSTPSHGAVKYDPFKPYFTTKPSTTSTISSIATQTQKYDPFKAFTIIRPTNSQVSTTLKNLGKYDPYKPFSTTKPTTLGTVRITPTLSSAISSTAKNYGKYDPFKPFSTIKPLTSNNTPKLIISPSSSAVTSSTSKNIGNYDPFKPFSTIKPLTGSTGTKLGISHSPSSVISSTPKNVGKYDPFKAFSTTKPITSVLDTKLELSPSSSSEISSTPKNIGKYDPFKAFSKTNPIITSPETQFGISPSSSSVISSTAKNIGKYNPFKAFSTTRPTISSSEAKFGVSPSSNLVISSTTKYIGKYDPFKSFSTRKPIISSTTTKIGITPTPTSRYTAKFDPFKPFSTVKPLTKPSPSTTSTTSVRYDPFKQFSTVKPLTVSTTTKKSSVDDGRYIQPSKTRDSGRYTPYQQHFAAPVVAQSLSSEIFPIQTYESIQPLVTEVYDPFQPLYIVSETVPNELELATGFFTKRETSKRETNNPAKITSTRSVTSSIKAKPAVSTAPATKHISKPQVLATPTIGSTVKSKPQITTRSTLKVTSPVPTSTSPTSVMSRKTRSLITSPSAGNTIKAISSKPVRPTRLDSQKSSTPPLILKTPTSSPSRPTATTSSKPSRTQIRPTKSLHPSDVLFSTKLFDLYHKLYGAHLYPTAETSYSVQKATKTTKTNVTTSS